jgi:hypothetical protein
VLLVLSYFTVLTRLLVTVLVSARVARISARSILARPGTLTAATVRGLGLLAVLITRMSGAGSVSA